MERGIACRGKRRDMEEVKMHSLGKTREWNNRGMCEKVTQVI